MRKRASKNASGSNGFLIHFDDFTIFGSNFFMVKDERFKRLNTDPVFKKAKRDSSKIVIDERFSAMLESNEFDNIEGRKLALI